MSFQNCMLKYKQHAQYRWSANAGQEDIGMQLGMKYWFKYFSLKTTHILFYDDIVIRNHI